MKTLGTFASFLLILGLFALFLWGAYMGVKYIIARLSFLDPTTSIILIIISTVALLCCLIIAGTIKANFGKRNVAFQQEKAAMYGKFVDVWLHSNKTGNEKEKLPAELEKLNKMIVLWGNSQVIRQYKQLLQMTGEEKQDKASILSQTEKVLLEMRKQAGEKNHNIKRKDLTGIILQNFRIQ
ncbi:MAG: hypothetical protein KGY70_16835 [Bacteroidales bacterium]|nr:hypothetical protein [Bacteroidales bacterium]